MLVLLICDVTSCPQNSIYKIIWPNKWYSLYQKRASSRLCATKGEREKRIGWKEEMNNGKGCFCPSSASCRNLHWALPYGTSALKGRGREVAWILQYESVLNSDMVVIYGRPLARLPQDPLPSLHLSCAVSIWTVWRELTHSCPISRKLCLVYSILAPV